jgi:arginase
MGNIRIIGVPMDLGTSRRGVDMGPFAVRYADLRERLEQIGHSVEDGGNVPVQFREDAEHGAQRGAKYLGAITDVCREVATRTRDALTSGRTPLVLGGDHSLAAGSIAGAAAHLAASGKKLGVIWVDAHADMNTPGSSRTGNVHGMPLAHLMGHGDHDLAAVAGVNPAVRAEHVALVGIRDLDEAEREHITAWKVHAFSMRELDERGVRSVMTDAIERVSRGTDGIWVSFDMDVVDSSLAPGVGTAAPGGMTFREAHLAMELLADTGRIVGMDLVEVNPVLDVQNKTAELGTQLVLSAFGKRIL